MGAFKMRRCVNGHEYEVLHFRGEVSVVAHGDDVGNLSCPECGTLEVEAEHFGTRIEAKVYGAGTFPYFDIGLGETVNSPSHREQIMKAKGLRDLSANEQERELDRINSARNAITRAREERMKTYQDRLASVPAMREAQDRVQRMMKDSGGSAGLMKRLYSE